MSGVSLLGNLYDKLFEKLIPLKLCSFGSIRSQDWRTGENISTVRKRTENASI